jgi:hypothetical protein
MLTHGGARGAARPPPLASRLHRTPARFPSSLQTLHGIWWKSSGFGPPYLTGMTALTRQERGRGVPVGPRSVLKAGAPRARSHCCLVLLLIHFIPDALTYSVPLFLRRQRDRTLLGTPAGPDPRAPARRPHNPYLSL